MFTPVQGIELVNPNADAEAKVLITGVVMNLFYTSRPKMDVSFLGVVVGWRTALLRKGHPLFLVYMNLHYRSLVYVRLTISICIDYQVRAANAKWFERPGFVSAMPKTEVADQGISLPLPNQANNEE